MTENTWSQHPLDYRQEEVRSLMASLQAGECVSLIGLSGMGKSNLLGYLAFRTSNIEGDNPILVYVDCNRLPELSAEGFCQLASHQLQTLLATPEIQEGDSQSNDFASLADRIAALIGKCNRSLAILLDGFDDLAKSTGPSFFNQLRALRDSFKYRLSFLLATRQPLEQITGPQKIREFDDLLVSNQYWLGPLSEKDARWTIQRFEERHALSFSEEALQSLLILSGRHPGLMKALAVAWPEGEPSDPASWLEHTAIKRECKLIWEDLPDESRTAIHDTPIKDEILHLIGLVKDGELFSPIFKAYLQQKSGSDLRLDRSTGEIFRGGTRLPHILTAKEFALLSYLLDHKNAICEKDELIRGVWPEDQVFEEGIRDDSLAQLVRRLRIKIEPDPSNPSFIQTIPGRGYRFRLSA